MEVLKGFQKVAMVSAIAVLAASGALKAHADNVATLGHINASVTSALTVTELSPIRFGNLINTATGTSAGGTTITLDPFGVRTVSGADMAAQNGATGAATETGSQQPGFYQISNGAEGAATVYVTFANSSGQVMDTFSHSANTTPVCNFATLSGTGPVGVAGASTSCFNANQFTLAQDDASLTGYGGASVTGFQNYGFPVTLAASTPTVVRVGATLTTVTGKAYPPGLYVGTYYVMVSY